jgi:hypothetical protein
MAYWQKDELETEDILITANAKATIVRKPSA